MQRTLLPTSFPFDTACGTGGLLRDLERLGLSDNKQELARFHAQLQQVKLHLKSARNEQLIPHDDTFTHVLTSLALDGITVDTLWLTLPIAPGTIRPDHGLTIIPARGNRKNRVLWQLEDGSRVEGVKAYWRGENISVDISPLRGGWVGQGTTACRVAFSLPNIQGKGDNWWPTDGRMAGLLIDRVQCRLSEIGIVGDLRSAKICRCDLNRNMVLNEPLDAYQDVWSALDVPRTSKTEWKSTGILCCNKSQGFNIYDKIAEMKTRGLPTDYLPKNLLRLEWRIKGARNARRHLGFDTVQALLDGWDALPALYIAQARKTLFRREVAAFKAPRRSDRSATSPTHAQIRNLFRWCRKNQVKTGFTMSALEKILRTGGIEAYSAKIKAVPGMNRKHAVDAVRRMREAVWQEKAQSDPDFVPRYAEIRAKAAGGYFWPSVRI